MSISRLTKPRTQTVRGMRGREDIEPSLPAILRADKCLLTCKIMFANVSAGALAQRFSALAERLGGTTTEARLEQVQRKLLSAISTREPATLGEIANAIGRGAPAVSRSVDTLVRAGLVERTHDPDNRRRLALRLSREGQVKLHSAPSAHGELAQGLERLAQSELRAIERAIEILERLPG